MHGCAIVGVKGGSPNRSVRAHWLVGAVAGWSSWLGGRGNFPPRFKFATVGIVFSTPNDTVLAVPTLEENIVLIQSSLFTLMIIVVCKLDYLMYINIKYVNTGDSSLTAERSFFERFFKMQRSDDIVDRPPEQQLKPSHKTPCSLDSIS